MQTDFNSSKSIVWFVDEFNSQQAAIRCLNDYDVKMEETYFDKVPYTVGNLKRKGSETPPGQMMLFAQPTNHLADYLKKLDLDNLSPMDALATLKELQEKAKKS